jgi:MraZ protein
MLIGSYLGSLGEKRRVAVHKSFLDEIGKVPILAKWYEDCLVLVSSDFWDKLLGRLTGGSRVASLGVRDIERFVLGSAFEVEPDSQGRIIIPELLANYAGFDKELVFAGLGDRVEIWSKEVWDKKSKDLAVGTKEYIEMISHRNEKQ